MTPEERRQKALDFNKRLHPEGKDQLTSDSPSFLSFQALVEFVKTLADTSNDAFTQFDKGKLVDVFIDETKTFATAEHFANHPLDDIEEELAARGIYEKVSFGVKTLPKEQAMKLIQSSTHKLNSVDNPDGTVTIEEYEEMPIHFEIKPLKDYVNELKKKRHAVNRERVNEIIRLAAASRLGEIANPTPQKNRELTPEMQRIRM